jgi:hypothetical protein
VDVQAFLVNSICCDECSAIQGQAIFCNSSDSTGYSEINSTSLFKCGDGDTSPSTGTLHLGPGSSAHVRESNWTACHPRNGPGAALQSAIGDADVSGSAAVRTDPPYSFSVEYMTVIRCQGN